MTKREALQRANMEAVPATRESAGRIERVTTQNNADAISTGPEGLADMAVEQIGRITLSAEKLGLTPAEAEPLLEQAKIEFAKIFELGVAAQKAARRLLQKILFTGALGLSMVAPKAEAAPGWPHEQENKLTSLQRMGEYARNDKIEHSFYIVDGKVFYYAAGNDLEVRMPGNNATLRGRSGNFTAGHTHPFNWALVKGWFTKASFEKMKRGEIERPPAPPSEFDILNALEDAATAQDSGKQHDHMIIDSNGTWHIVVENNSPLIEAHRAITNDLRDFFGSITERERRILVKLTATRQRQSGIDPILNPTIESFKGTASALRKNIPAGAALREKMFEAYFRSENKHRQFEDFSLQSVIYAGRIIKGYGQDIVSGGNKPGAKFMAALDIENQKMAKMGIKITYSSR